MNSPEGLWCDMVGLNNYKAITLPIKLYIHFIQRSNLR